MKGLLIKDYRLLMRQKNFFLIVVIVGLGAMATSDEPGFLIGYLSFIFPMFVLSTISYDEFDNGNAFLFSLPITRTEYVREKYVFGIVTGMAAWLFAVIVTTIYQLIVLPGFEVAEWILASIAIIGVIVFLLSFMIPVQLKFGGEKGRIAMLGGIGVVFIIGFIAYKIGELLHVDPEQMLDQIGTWSTGMLATGIAVILLVVLLASMMISGQIMKKKEF